MVDQESPDRNVIRGSYRLVRARIVGVEKELERWNSRLKEIQSSCSHPSMKKLLGSHEYICDDCGYKE